MDYQSIAALSTVLRGFSLVAKASGSPITSGTVNYYLKALTGTNAGKWWKTADGTWAASETANAIHPGGSGSGFGTDTRRLQIIAEITYYDIDAEILEELCRLGIDCCSDTDGGGVIPPPTSGTSGTGSQTLEDCEHSWTVGGTGGTSGDDPCEQLSDPSIVPRWFLEAFVNWVATLPVPLQTNLLPIANLASACLNNPANVTDADLRMCMVNTGVGANPPNPSFYSYMLTRWNQWLQVNEAQLIAECLGIDPGTGPNVETVPPIDLEWMELELDDDALTFVRRECVEITDECNICDLTTSMNV